MPETRLGRGRGGRERYSVVRGKTPSLAASFAALAAVAFVTYAVQLFLFPIEDYWIVLVAGLLAYGLAEWLLIRAHRIVNLFTALDQGNFQVADALLPCIGPLAISAALSAAGSGLFLFLYAAFFMICLLYTALAAAVEHIVLRIRGARLIAPGVQSRLWLASAAYSVLIFGAAFFSVHIQQPVHPGWSGDPAVRGIWFTIPVDRTDLFPLGYARLEDSVFDDLGRTFVAVLGEDLGLVAACDAPGPYLSRAVSARIPGISPQPKYNYAVDAMCPNWIATLRGFFWQIGLFGTLLLALVLGIAGFRDPIDLAILSVILLFGWATWPAPAPERMGNVAVLVAGMPLIAIVFPLFRSGRYSFLVLWGMVSGVLFGLSAFVRRPCGLALLLTALVALVYLGIRQRKLGVALVASFALLVGNNAVPVTLNGLFLYRDTKLQISAPNISPLAHGSGFPLLGGVGGTPTGDAGRLAPQYPNSLDVAFLDASIWYVAYDTNPMIGFAQKSFTLMQQTSQRIFLDYVEAHPLQYLRISMGKTLETAVLMLKVPTRLPAAVVLLLGLLALRYILLRRSLSNGRLPRGQLPEMLAAFLVLALMAALPAVLTSPGYGESVHLPAAIMFFTLMAGIQYLFRILATRAGQNES